MSVGIGDEQIRRLLDEVIASLELEFTPRQIEQLDRHFSLLLKWNARINLSSIRDEREIAWRHFGESLFLAKLMTAPRGLIVDIGSGAGFPGLPIKVAWAEVQTLLLEPNHKKATFLKEVIRSSGLEGIEVRAERLEQFVHAGMAGSAALVTMRAVAPTPRVLGEAARLLAQEGKVALFTSEEKAWQLSASGEFRWLEPAPIPNSLRRVVLIGSLPLTNLATNPKQPG